MSLPVIYGYTSVHRMNGLPPVRTATCRQGTWCAYARSRFEIDDFVEMQRVFWKWLPNGWELRLVSEREASRQ